MTSDIDPHPSPRLDYENAFEMVVDGNRFKIVRGDDAGYNVRWLNAPNPPYGYTEGRSDDADQPAKDVVDGIRDFIQQVDPKTGFIPDYDDDPFWDALPPLPTSRECELIIDKHKFLVTWDDSDAYFVEWPDAPSGNQSFSTKPTDPAARSIDELVKIARRVISEARTDR